MHAFLILSIIFSKRILWLHTGSASSQLTYAEAKKKIQTSYYWSAAGAIIGLVANTLAIIYLVTVMQQVDNYAQDYNDYN